MAKADPVTGMQALGRPRKRRPAMTIEPFMEIDGYARAMLTAPAFTRESRRQYGRIIDDQNITGDQQIRQIPNAAIDDCRITTRPHLKQPRRITRAHGMKRNMRLGQLKIEKINLHDV